MIGFRPNFAKEKNMPDTATVVDNADLHLPPEADATVEEATPKSSDSLAPTDIEQEAPESTKDVIETYAADAEKVAQNAIVDLSTAIKSADTTNDQVEKATTQSTDMQTGAQVAADTAKQSLLVRFKAVVEHFGEEMAADIRADLAKLHDAEAVVAKVFKLGGADSAEVP